jgi:hypothetical protein
VRPLPRDGDRFGTLTVVGESYLVANEKDPKRARRRVMTVCDCGARKARLWANLHEGVRCIDCRSSRTPGGPPVGTIYGRLTVVARPVSFPVRPRVRVPVQCTCGRYRFVEEQLMRRGLLASCGSCVRLGEEAASFVHGGSYDRLYRVWAQMRNRCRNVNEPRYGGRGITVCPEWDDYSAFRDWSLSHGYADGLQIDRYPNRDGNYEPGNCRWTTALENQRNKDVVRYYELWGESKTARMWSEDPRASGIGEQGIRLRVAAGWSVERAVTTPSYRKPRQASA